MTWRNLDYPAEIEEAAIEWRLKVSSGNLTAEQEKAFALWCASDPRHEDAYDQAVSLWSALGTLDESKLDPALLRDTKSKTTIRDVFSKLTHFSARRRRWAIGGLTGVAAAVSFVIFSQAWPSQSIAIVSAPAPLSYSSELGETKTITLADQSNITLGAASELQVAMSDTERRVTLISGAAVFDVSKDPARPFIVEAERFTATVLGTVFDVRKSAGIVRLSVAEGAVEVDHPLMLNAAPTSMSSKRTITAGQMISATEKDGLSGVEPLRPEDFATWREGRLRYKNATLAELIVDANRYSDRRIILSEDLIAYSGDRATMIFDGNDIDRLLNSLPILFPVIVEENSEGDVLIAARPELN